MADEPNNERAVIERYLLGEMSEDEQTQFEDSYFANPDLLQRVQEDRSELIDAYARGELDARQRELFERRLRLSPSLRRSVEFARSLYHKLEDPNASTAQRTGTPTRPDKTSSKWINSYLPMAAVLLVAVIGVTFLVTRLDQGRGDSQKVANATTPVVVASPIASPSASSAAMPSPTMRPSVVMIVLRSDLTRDGNVAREMKISPEVRTVVIQAEVDAQEWERHRSHEAEISTPEGKLIWRGEGSSLRFLKSSELMELTLPAPKLLAGDYVLRLSGTGTTGQASSLGSFYFSVLRP